MSFHMGVDICNSLWALIEHPEDVCEMVSGQKSSSRFKAFFYLYLFLTIFINLWKTIPYCNSLPFLSLFSLSHLLTLPLTQSTQPITSYPLHLFKIALFSSFFDLYVSPKSPQKYPYILGIHDWLHCFKTWYVLLWEHFVALFRWHAHQRSYKNIYFSPLHLQVY